MGQVANGPTRAGPQPVYVPLASESGPDRGVERRRTLLHASGCVGEYQPYKAEDRAAPLDQGHPRYLHQRVDGAGIRQRLLVGALVLGGCSDAIDGPVVGRTNWDADSTDSGLDRERWTHATPLDQMTRPRSIP